MGYLKKLANTINASMLLGTDIIGEMGDINESSSRRWHASLTWEVATPPRWGGNSKDVAL